MDRKEMTIHHIRHDDRDAKAACQAANTSWILGVRTQNRPDGGGQMVNTDKKGSAPGYTPELGARIEKAIDAMGGLMAASRKLGRSKDALSKWRDGVSKISLADITELATAAQMDPVWLAFGDVVAGLRPNSVPVDAIREAWDFWMPVIFRLNERPDPEALREQFINDVLERATHQL